MIAVATIRTCSQTTERAGSFPYTRGIRADGYRARPWTMRQYAGFASADETNARFRLLLERGQTGLSTAFDLPTQLGLDSDDPLALGEVGRTGVAIDSLDDMRRLFAQIPLDEVSTSMTINAPAAVLLLLYELVGEEQGVEPGRAARHRAERRAQGVRRARQLHLPAAALDAPDGRRVPLLPRARAALQRDLDLGLPHPRGRLERGPGDRVHARERIAYVEAAVAAGLAVDDLAPRLSFFFNAHNDVFVEVAKFRAARRLWALTMRDRFGARDERSQMLRFHAQTGGSTLTAQQPLNNVVRVALQAFSATPAARSRCTRTASTRRSRCPPRPRRRSRCAPSRSSRPSRGRARARPVRRLVLRRGPD